MTVCKHCGFQIPDSSNFCPGCGAKKEISHTVTIVGEGPEKSMPKLSNDELLVKRYECAQIKFPKCKGYLSVTNKRVIFHGSAKKSIVCKEVNLESVSGLDCFRGVDVKIGKIIIGAIMGLIGLILLFDSDDVTLPLILLAAGIFIVLSGFRQSYILNVFSNKANGSPISVGAGPSSLIGNGALYTLSCVPTRDTALMISELGALILDLQTLGDNAIPMWKK